MHVLDYLSNAEKNIQYAEDGCARLEYRVDENSVGVEYRLVCSGTLHPSHFLGDWRHSDRARILLSLPVTLLVASQPYDDYPQELVLRFVVLQVEEQDGNVTHLSHPDAEIASDLAAILTLLCRRLVTVAGKVAEQHDAKHVPAVLADYPIPVVTQVRMSHWAMRPLEFQYGLEGVGVKSYQPPAVAFGSGEIIETLLALPALKDAVAVVRAARLYASAMERIESQVEISYQLFISAVETMAGSVLEGWEPERQKKLESGRALVTHATQNENLGQDVAERLALAACQGYSWANAKFKKFLMDNLDRAVLSEADDLFMVPQEMCPKGDDIERAIGEVYRVRSGATHSGKSYPASAAIGPSVSIPSKAIGDLLNERRPFPPIGWFERVVNNAICGFIRSQVRQAATGFVGAGDPHCGGKSGCDKAESVGKRKDGLWFPGPPPAAAGPDDDA